MEKSGLSGIRSNPLFGELVRRRGRFVAWLSAATLVPYYAFILVASFNPQLLAARFATTGAMTVGWPIGVALIVGTWLLTGLYVRRANSEFDELTAKILSGASK